jgi:hypothetical protein
MFNVAMEQGKPNYSSSSYSSLNVRFRPLNFVLAPAGIGPEPGIASSEIT